jgi:hypothetical protein
MDILSKMSAGQCMSWAGLSGGTTTTINTTGTIIYAILGKAYNRAQLSNGATPTTDYVTGAAFVAVPANYGSVYTIGFNAAGDLKVVQGEVQALDAQGNFVTAPQFGPIPNDFCPIGYLVIKAGSTASSSPGWVFGTSNQSGVTGITYDFQNCITLPDRPQVG